MKRFLSVGLLILCCVPLFAKTRAEKIREDLLSRNPNKVFVASHRADWRNWPENSIPGINSAIDMGVDIVEIDLQLTKDSVLIIMHDAKVDRTTTGKGKISDLTYDEISKMRLKNGASIYTRHKVPTLALPHSLYILPQNPLRLTAPKALPPAFSQPKQARSHAIISLPSSPYRWEPSRYTCRLHYPPSSHPPH